MYYLAKFGSLLVPEYDVEIDWGAAVTGMTVMTVPGGAFDLYGSAPAPIAPQLITLSARMRHSPAAKLRQYLEAWMAKVGSTDTLFRAMRGVTSQDYATARLEEVRIPTSGSIDRTYTNVIFVWQMLTPWKRGGLTLQQTGAANGAMTIVHTGNRVSLPILRAVVTDATSVRFHHNGIGAGRIASLQVLMPSTPVGNDTLVIDTAALSVTVNGANAYSGFSFLSDHKRNEWMPILPGSNPLQISVYPASALVNWSVTYDVVMR